MGIKTDVTIWGSTLVSQAGTFTNTLTQKFKQFVSDAEATVSGIFTDDVIGMNVSEIENMKSAVQTYVNGIETALGGIKDETSTELSSAFASSEMRTAVDGFLDAVMTACKAYTSQLLKFYDLLDSVSKQYTAQTNAMKQTLDTEAQKTAESIERYSVGDAADATPAA